MRMFLYWNTIHIHTNPLNRCVKTISENKYTRGLESVYPNDRSFSAEMKIAQKTFTYSISATGTLKKCEISLELRIETTE